LQRYVYALAHENHLGLPEIEGSCFFIEVQGVVFLVTASHVIDKRTVLEKWWVSTEQGLRRLAAVGFATHGPPDGRDDVDVAAYALRPDFLAHGGINVIPQSMWVSSIDMRRRPTCRALSGFPISKNKNSQALNKKLLLYRAVCYTYFGSARYEGDYAAYHKTPSTHVGLNYLPGTNEAGNEVMTPIYTRGMSGGPMWLIPDIHQPTNAYLEGVFIEYWGSRPGGHAFATRLDSVVSHIEHFIADSYSKPVVKIVAIGDISKVEIRNDVPFAGALRRIRDEAKGTGVTINPERFYSEFPVELHNFTSSITYCFIDSNGTKAVAYYIEDRDFYSCSYIEVNYEGATLFSLSESILSKRNKSEDEIKAILRANRTLGIFRPFVAELQ
jgi:hypothetical protein